MEAFNRTIKKLSQEEYELLLKEISSDRKESKPYMVLEASRLFDYDDNEMMEKLAVNSSTYYTLKSRLNAKVAAILSKKVYNPISVLMEEVARVPANLYGTSREVSIRALKDLEKQLLEYDLSNELISVYKTLARLNLHNYDYEYYNKLYNKYVAYSLAVVKAENLFYEFITRVGKYQLTRSETDLENIQSLRRELSNIRDLYESHRLFVLYNIVNIYYQCILTNDENALRMKEIEIDNTLKEIDNIFTKYELDTFYQNNKFLVDMLYFEYYQKTNNVVRADYYFKRTIPNLTDLAKKHILNFNMVQFLYSRIGVYMSTGDLNYLAAANDEIEGMFDIDKDEVYHFVYIKQYFAICKFYEGDYSKTARLLNDLRNSISLRNYFFADVQLKMFQALQYALMGDEELATQLINSVKRQISDETAEWKNIRTFLKMLGVAIKPGDFKKKFTKMAQLWKRFQEENLGHEKVLAFVNLDEKLLKKLSEPYKGMKS